MTWGIWGLCANVFRTNVQYQIWATIHIYLMLNWSMYHMWTTKRTYRFLHCRRKMILLTLLSILCAPPFVSGKPYLYLIIIPLELFLFKYNWKSQKMIIYKYDLIPKKLFNDWFICITILHYTAQCYTQSSYVYFYSLLFLVLWHLLFIG